ncbi:MAG: hypothetical protein ABI620_00205 [Chloroflexota bacterium]
MIVRLLRIARLAVLGLVLVACSSGLGSTEGLWCAQHLAAVDEAAAGLQIATAQTKYQEPSWLPDYVTGTLNFTNALIAANAAFIASCDAAAEKRGVGETRLSWCATDGLADVWDASITLGLMVDVDAQTYAYKAMPLTQRRSDADFVRACRAAFGARTT